jgi:predicted Zn finger-like uncharacterized protein
MIIRCDNCSVSLQLDESKIPSGKFSVRCPRCQNLLRVDKSASAVDQLAENKAAPVAAESPDFKAKEQDLEINAAMKSLLAALSLNQKSADISDDDDEKAAGQVRLQGLCRADPCAGERAFAGR